jgi:hypothetical protein
MAPAISTVWGKVAITRLTACGRAAVLSGMSSLRYLYRLFSFNGWKHSDDTIRTNITRRDPRQWAGIAKLDRPNRQWW